MFLLREGIPLCILTLTTSMLCTRETTRVFAAGGQRLLEAKILPGKAPGSSAQRREGLFKTPWPGRARVEMPHGGRSCVFLLPRVCSQHEALPIVHSQKMCDEQMNKGMDRPSGPWRCPPASQIGDFPLTLPHLSKSQLANQNQTNCPSDSSAPQAATCVFTR